MVIKKQFFKHKSCKYAYFCLTLQRQNSEKTTLLLMKQPVFSLNVRGVAHDYVGAQVMGIINVTPDSFYAGSRIRGEEALRQRVAQILAEGGSMIDIGAYSTRPDAAEVSAQEELDRLAQALPVVLNELSAQGRRDVLVSVDTFRASVAEASIMELGADIINDVSGGTLDEGMFAAVARTQAPYILMHMRGTPQTMQQLTRYDKPVTEAVADFFTEQLTKLRTLAPAAQVILDPGFGFAKTLDQNYELFAQTSALMSRFPDCPMLVGISRKSMIYRLLDTTADEALNGTTVLNTLATQMGAHILRVHDVKAAVEAVRIVRILAEKTINF